MTDASTSKITIASVCELWRNPETRPAFAVDVLIDDGDGFGDVCRCAQGEVLHLAGWSDFQLRHLSQARADREVADVLGISLSHAILLRAVNDGGPGMPEDVLDRPENILGDKAPIIIAFWRHLDGLDGPASDSIQRKLDPVDVDEWDKASFHVEHVATKNIDRTALGLACTSTNVGRYGLGALAEFAVHEIMAAEHLKEFYFLPFFGFATPADIPTAS